MIKILSDYQDASSRDRYRLGTHTQTPGINQVKHFDNLENNWG
jgi:hypothetical protein